MSGLIDAGVRFIAGTRAITTQASERVRLHTGPIWQEVLAEPIGRSGLIEHVNEGRDLHLLVHGTKSRLDSLRSDAVDIVDYDAGTWTGVGFQHSKMMYLEPRPNHPEEAELWFSNFTYDDDRGQIAAVLTGEQAWAGGQVIKRAHALAGGDRRAEAKLHHDVQQAAEAAVLINEPMVGLTPLADAQRGMLRDPRGRLDVMMKRITDAESVELLEQARRSRVPGYTGAREVTADVPHAQFDETFRANLMATGGKGRWFSRASPDEALLSTSYLAPSMMQRVAYPSRDSGLALGGEAARDAQRLAQSYADRSVERAQRASKRATG